MLPLSPFTYNFLFVLDILKNVAVFVLQDACFHAPFKSLYLIFFSFSISLKTLLFSSSGMLVFMLPLIPFT